MDLSFSSSNISITRYPQEGLMGKQSLGEKKRPPVEEMNRSLIGKKTGRKKKETNSLAASPISICIAALCGGSTNTHTHTYGYRSLNWGMSL